MYMGFMDLKMACDIVNREALWQGLRMYDVDGKLLSRIKSMYVNSLVCVRVGGSEGDWFRIDSVVRWVYHIPSVFHCILLSLRSNPSKQHSKVLYRWGVGEEERQENTEK